eukprot:3615003-Pyramimonas_sp.AAC.1
MIGAWLKRDTARSCPTWDPNKDGGARTWLVVRNTICRRRRAILPITIAALTKATATITAGTATITTTGERNS